MEKDELCSESDAHLEKIIKLEQSLLSQGFHFVKLMRKMQSPHPVDDYECLVFIPSVEELTEIGFKHYQRKYLTNNGIMKVYGLIKSK